MHAIVTVAERIVLALSVSQQPSGFYSASTGTGCSNLGGHGFFSVHWLCSDPNSVALSDLSFTPLAFQLLADVQWHYMKYSHQFLHLKDHASMLPEPQR